MPAPGDVLLHRYTIRAPLGRGGMGSVYRAFDERLTIEVAVKELTPPPGARLEELAALRDQFKQEATVLARLKHPSLVSVTDFFEEGGSVYLVMNLVPGESLAERVERAGPLAESLAVDLGVGLLDALDYCHQRGVLHRDIKPNNIILQPDGSALGAPVLVDFGLVKLWDPANPTTHTLVRGIGSPNYASPEHYGFALSHTDARSDLYSVGATLYYALTANDPPAATDRLLRPEIMPPLWQVAPWVSPNVAAAVSQALAMQPERRFTGARAMRAALLGAPVAAAGLSEIGTAATTAAVATSPITPVAARRGPPVWALAAGVLLALILVGGGAWLAGRIGGQNAPQPTEVSNVVPLPTDTRSGGATIAPVTAVPTKTEPPSPPTDTPLSPPTDTPPPSPTATVGVIPAGGDVRAAAMSAPTIDGDLSEWGMLPAYDSPFLVYNDGAWDRSEDVSVLWRLGWDSANLYIAARVSDNLHVQTQTGNQIYKGDGLEIQIDTNLTTDNGDSLTPDEYQVNLSPGDFSLLPPSANLGRGTSGGSMFDAPGGHHISVAARPVDDGYTVEAAVPWADMGLAPSAARSMRIALNVDDNDRPGEAVQETMYSNAPNRRLLDPTTWLPFALSGG